MIVSGLTEDQVRRAVEQAGVALRRRLVRRGESWSLTIRARSREDRARGYRDLCARIFEANVRAAIAPCFVGDLLLYPVGLEEETVTPEDAVPVGVSADRWAEFNRKFCALLHRGLVAGHAGVDMGGRAREAGGLAGAGGEDPGADDRGRLAGGAGDELGVGQGWDLEVEIDAVEEGCERRPR